MPPGVMFSIMMSAPLIIFISTSLPLCDLTSQTRLRLLAFMMMK